jgi:hypothetical protein
MTEDLLVGRVLKYLLFQVSARYYLNQLDVKPSSGDRQIM